MSKRGQAISLGVDLFNPAGAVADTAAPASPPSEPEPPATAAPRRAKPAAPRRPASEPAPQAAEQEATDVWSWSGAERMGSHRYPVELLDLLDQRTRALDLPIGLTLAAALAHALELPDDELAELVRGRGAQARQAAARVALGRPVAPPVARRQPKGRRT